MITEEQINLLIERLINRIEEANTYFLMKMGASIGKIKELTPTQAQKLVQILKYGGSYEDIIREISKYTNLNVKDIDEIFKSYAKEDQLFYKQFYKYRNIPFIEYAKNEPLKRQTEALANIVKNEMYNFTRANVLGYTIRDLQGRLQFLGLKETYNRVLDEALLNVGQGKETFDSAMTRIMKDIGGSGLKTVEFESGRAIRLDSAVRMHLKGRLRELHNENQKIIGKEIDADGVEISVHANPAPDHAEVQGRQFTIDKKDKNGKIIKKGEFEKLQEYGVAKTYNGINIDLHMQLKNNQTALGFRPISEMNCYHYVFSVVLGVSKPEYDDKQLQKIIDDNNKGFEYDGKHYTNYEGTQLQRALERKIREQKDMQILAKASGDDKLVGESQLKITQLTRKYKQLSDASGLPTKMQRMKVSGYRRTSKTKIIQNKIENDFFDITEKWSNQKNGEQGIVENRNLFIDNKNNKYVVDNVNVILDHTKSEFSIANFFAKQKETDILMLPRVLKPQNIKSADFIEKTSGKLWEIKEPKGNTIGTTILNQFKGQKEKAHNFIIDMHNSDMSINTAISEIESVLKNKRYDWIEEVVLLKSGKIEKVFNRTKK